MLWETLNLPHVPARPGHHTSLCRAHGWGRANLQDPEFPEKSPPAAQSGQVVYIFQMCIQKRRLKPNDRGAANCSHDPYHERYVEMSVETLDETVDQKLLTEIERQEAVLSELPEGYEFPLFDGKQAIESQRKSGYKNTARAAREIVDNALEAGAENVWVVMKRPSEAERAKNERRDAVSAVGFIDDGPGMLPTMARYALSWGGGTHFDDPTGIGRFGFGLPNSSINQTRRVEVYTRTGAKQAWVCAVLDINNVKQHGLVRVDPPVEANPPAFVLEYMKKNRITLKAGTIVVWDKPDRLTARSASTLRTQMLDDFGVVYRNLLDDFKLVDGQFDEAVKYQTKALQDEEFARVYGDEARPRLELFREMKPYHEAP
jgi:hypothetical protein